MGRTVRQLWFKHTNGALKRIPGVVNSLELAPKMIQDVEYLPNGTQRPVWRANMDHVVKVTLMDEDVEVHLTEREKKMPEAVQNSILARRAQEADAILQANEALRAAVRSYEQRGGIKVLEWDKEVDLDSPEAQGSVISELSAIAIADFEDRGIPIPDKFKRTAKAVVDSGSVEVKYTPKKSKE